LDRERFNYLINSKTLHSSLFEPSQGSTGVNIKVLVYDNIENEPITRYKYINDTWLVDTIPYRDYLLTLDTRERLEQLTRNKNNTFLVFHTGKVIMSSRIGIANRKKAFDMFMNFVTQYRSEFEIKIQT
jgi:hypothetical protein